MRSSRLQVFVRAGSANSMVVLPVRHLQVFVRACSGNSVVVLPTGVGKTLVAALAVAQMRRLNPSKWVVFLTETCPLAEQQGLYLRTELAADDAGQTSGTRTDTNNNGLVQVGTRTDTNNNGLVQVGLDSATDGIRLSGREGRHGACSPSCFPAISHTPAPGDLIPSYRPARHMPPCFPHTYPHVHLRFKRDVDSPAHPPGRTFARCVHTFPAPACHLTRQVLHGDNSTPAERVALIGQPPGILVSTAGCFIGLLGLGFDLQACCLLVLDEAHHAVKKHPFR